MKLKSLIILLFAIILSAGVTYADKKGGARIQMDESSFNFGKVPYKGAPVSHEFTFTNTGDKNLVILEVRTTCGCTKPEYTQQPIAPGKTGKIKITYDATSHSGYFSKNITVRTNGKPGKFTLKISGTVENPGDKK